MEPVYRYDIDQRTEEWDNMRRIRFTASHATAIKAHGSGLDTYVKEIARGYFSRDAHKEFSEDYSNRHIERGNKYEEIARSIYELETGNQVKQVGIITLGEYYACSPDGLVNEDGLIEIKCMGDKKFYEYATSQKIDPNHYNQMQMQLLISDRKYCHYCVFNPNFSPSLIIKTITRDNSTIEHIKQGLKKGVELLKHEITMANEILEPIMKGETDGN